MWIWGLLVFLLFEQLILRWYVPNTVKSRLDQPMIFYKRWLHPAILAIGLGLLVLSCYLFAKTSVWLIVVPIILAVVASQRRAWIRSNRINAAISSALNLYYQFRKEGESELEAKRHVLAAMVKDDADSYGNMIRGTDDLLGGEWSMSMIILILILPRLGLKFEEPDFLEELQKKERNPNYVSEREKLEALINYYDGECKKR
jgi:hypothetical protein